MRSIPQQGHKFSELRMWFQGNTEGRYPVSVLMKSSRPGCPGCVSKSCRHVGCKRRQFLVNVGMISVFFFTMRELPLKSSNNRGIGTVVDSDTAVHGSPQ